LVWLPVFSSGWTKAVRLYYLGGAIAALTAKDTLHVNRLDVPSWGRFLQILEDAGPAWVVAVLYTPAAQNITTRDALKNLLTANDPGFAVPVSGGLDALAHKPVKCWKCVMPGHFARHCPVCVCLLPSCSGLSQALAGLPQGCGCGHAAWCAP
jgi:hypothetical protein